MAVPKKTRRSTKPCISNHREDAWGKIDTGHLEAIDETRTHACGLEATDDDSVIRHALTAESEDFLRGYHVSFHRRDFRDARDTPRAIGESRYLNDHIERGGDLLAHRLARQTRARELNHRFDTGQSVARRV